MRRIILLLLRLLLLIHHVAVRVAELALAGGWIVVAHVHAVHSIHIVRTHVRPIHGSVHHVRSLHRHTTSLIGEAAVRPHVLHAGKLSLLLLLLTAEARPHSHVATLDESKAIR